MTATPPSDPDSTGLGRAETVEIIGVVVGKFEAMPIAQIPLRT